MTKSISTEQTPANIQQVLGLLGEAPTKLASLSRGLSDEQLHTALGPGEHSPHGILAHILNCEARTFEAITLALLADEPVFTPIHPERELGKLLRLEQQTFSALLGYFQLRRRVLLGVLTPLTEKKWARVIREEGKQRRESVYWQARGQALHEKEHIADIEQKIIGKLNEGG